MGRITPARGAVIGTDRPSSPRARSVTSDHRAPPSCRTASLTHIDPAAVAPVPTLLSAPYGGQQPILPHQPQQRSPWLSDDLPVAFAQEVALLQHLSDLLHQLLVAHSSSVLASSALPARRSLLDLGPRRPSSAPPARPRRSSSEGRAALSPDSPASALQELLQLVPVPPFFQEFSRKSRIVNSPSFARVRVSSRSPGSRPRRLSPC